eukprot:1320337-Ditylum_brightwellii.AAC.1
MEEYGVDIFAFVETNIPWTLQNKYKMRDHGRQRFQNIKMEMCSSNKPAINIYKPGGASVGVVGKTQGRVITVENNPHGLGRWSMVCLTGEDTKLYVVSTNQVAQEDNDRVHTAYIQQYRLLKQKEVESPNPCKK